MLAVRAFIQTRSATGQNPSRGGLPNPHESVSCAHQLAPDVTLILALVAAQQL